MKAYGVVFLTIIFIVIALTIASMVTIFFAKKTQTKDIRFTEDIYVIQNAVEAADIYFKASLDYAVFQAIYDVGKNGGLEKTWTKKPKESEVVSALKKTIVLNLNNYTKEKYIFFGKSVNLPTFIEDDIEVKLMDDGVSVSIKSGKSLYYCDTKTGEQGKVSMRFEKSVDIEKIYGIKFSKMLKKAYEIFDSLSKISLPSEKGKHLDGYPLSENDLDVDAVLHEIHPGNKIIKINITQKDFKIPVYVDKKVLYEPVTFTFFVDT
ncbi:MAG: hypothetical protein J7K72_01465 [Candidatus Aenigmarchaeota archaeon]|nr:hypothetical protein [Candidatus Aenigmarchaeota archaeon]